MILVGVGSVAILQLMAAGTVCNATSAELTTAIALANNLREKTLTLAFADPTTPDHWGREADETTSVSDIDDLDDLDGRTFSPPLDALGIPLLQHAQWAEQVTVASLDPNYLAGTLPAGATKLRRVTVKILHQGLEVHCMSWVIADVP
jgi:hypothetical protein